MKKLICAIDTPNLDNACSLIKKIHPYIDVIKLGLEFFASCGIGGIEKIADFNLPIFLDLKLHDIPNTVKKTLNVIKQILGVQMTTVHIAGGAEMIKVAKDVLQNTKIKLLGVTLLTSLAKSDLKSIDINCETLQYVKNLAVFGQKHGLDGVICSLHEADLIKQCCKQNFLTITPGIGSNNDQKRSIDPEQIKNYNADYIVIGRAITQAKDPVESACRFATFLGQKYL